MFCYHIMRSDFGDVGQIDLDHPSLHTTTLYKRDLESPVSFNWKTILSEPHMKLIAM